MTEIKEQYALNNELAERLEQVIAAPRAKRGEVWNSVRTELSRLIAAFENGGNHSGLLAGSEDAERFVLQVKTYVRALSTYRASSDAWLDMFRAFLLLLRRTGVLPASPERRTRLLT